MPKPLVVVGSLNLDLVMHVEHIPAVGETVPGLGYEESLGGKGANQAVAAAKLGAPVQMVGCVGSDAYGQRLLNGMRDAGVDATAVKVVEGSSGLAVVTHAKDGSNAIVVQAGANEMLNAGELTRHLEQIRGAAMVMLQLESPMESVLLATQIAYQHGGSVMLDPAPARALSSELLRCTTWLTPNETEADALLGERSSGENPAETAKRLLMLGARNVALKLGERGVYLFGEDCPPVHVPAFRVKAVDTTAAGDCFNAAFASRLIQGDAPATSALYANAAAALCVTRSGAQTAMPSASEVAEFLQMASARSC